MRTRARVVGVVGLGLMLGISAPGAAQQPGRAEQAQVIVARDGRLTVRARGIPLVKLLRLIAARTGVGVAVTGDLDVRVTADLDDVEPAEAIRQLVKNHATVWIAKPAARTPAGAGLSDSPDARARARAVMALGGVKTPEAAAALHTALGDSAPYVRIQAAHALRRSQGGAAVPLLEQVAANDPDPKVRLAALRSLSFLPGGASARALQHASRDADASVRQEAIRRLSAGR
jgi:HEAT repeat protein